MSTVLVIGASRGIGLELVRQYLARGDRVIATVRDDAARQQLQALGAQVLLVDVAQPASVSGLAWQLDGEVIDTALYVAGVMSRAANVIGDEIGDYVDALADDPLTDAAKTAITNAKTKATATKAALEARVTALGSSSSNGSDDRPCPGGRGGRGDRFGDDDGGDQGPWS